MKKHLQWQQHNSCSSLRCAKAWPHPCGSRRKHPQPCRGDSTAAMPDPDTEFISFIWLESPPRRASSCRIRPGLSAWFWNFPLAAMGVIWIQDQMSRQGGNSGKASCGALKLSWHYKWFSIHRKREFRLFPTLPVGCWTSKASDPAERVQLWEPRVPKEQNLFHSLAWADMKTSQWLSDTHHLLHCSFQDGWTGRKMRLLPEQISASARGQKEVQSFPPQRGKWGFLWVSGKGWEHSCVKSPQLCHLPCPKNFHKLWLPRNHGLSLPPVSSLLSENVQSCFIISHYIISQVCQIDEVGFTTGLSFFTQTEAFPLSYPTL